MYQGRYITLSDTSNDTSDCGHVSHTCTCGCSVIHGTHNASLQVMPQVCLMIMHYSLPASPVASSPVPALAPAASPRAALLAHRPQRAHSEPSWLHTIQNLGGGKLADASWTQASG